MKKIEISSFALALVLAFSPALGEYVVQFPPENGASISLYSPYLEPFTYSSANVHVVVPSHGYAVYDSADCEGKIVLGNATFPSVGIYQPSQPLGLGYTILHQTADFAVGFKNGMTPISVSSNKGYVGCTGEAGEMTPPFGLPQVTQRGNYNPYADGTTTMHANACFLCTILSSYRYLYGNHTKTLEELNDEMNRAGGYGGEGRDVILPVACRLLGMVLVGSYSFQDATIQKYMARGWAMPVRTLHWNRQKTKLCTHWVGMCPGLRMEDRKFCYPMMDPFLRANWFAGSYYKPNNIRVLSPIGPKTVNGIRYELLNYGWWENPRYSSPLPLTGMEQTVGTGNGTTSSDNPDVSVGEMAQIWAKTNKGIKIDRIVGPELDLTSASEIERATLIDETELEIDASDCIEDPTDIPDFPLPDCSEATINFPVQGDYTLTLSGAPGTSFHLTMFFGYADETWNVNVLNGEIGSNGLAVLTVSYDPITTVFRLGALRRMTIGSKVFLTRLNVTAKGENEIFCQNPERICGVRVISESLVLPSGGESATIQGTVAQTDPEIVVMAQRVVSQGPLIEPVKPFCFAGQWPKMANCLLGRMAGKVEEITGEGIALVRVGNSSIEVTNFPSGFSAGDWIAFNAILRAGSRARVVGEVSRVADR